MEGCRQNILWLPLTYLLWQIYSAVKKSTKQAASVFVLERALLDRFEKGERELIWEMMKKGVGQLTRLRHPRILTVQHPLEESRDCLAFATEPVFASLTNVLGSQVDLIMFFEPGKSSLGPAAQSST